MSKNDIKLTTKVSSLISGQAPDFVRTDHSLFLKFLKDYYKFLEAGRLTITATVDYVKQETVTTNYILQEDGERTVTESGTGSDGQFVNGETITGGTSNATATVLVEDSRNKFLYTTSQQLFITGETITGSTSGSTATVVEYRANPVQNIQQLLEYGNTDTTIYDFLEKLRLSFMAGIPNSLATGVSKRNLIKNIKDLYAAKGTTEATKLFSRLFLGEEATVLLPNEFIMKPSAGDFRQKTILRASPDSGVVGSEIIGQVITGVSSGATAVIESSVEFQQVGVPISELQLANQVGSFTDGERFTATSTTKDLEVGFTVRPIVSSGTVTNAGILHDAQELIDVESIGNGSAVVRVGGIKRGSVSGVEIDNVGTNYEVGDAITFTPVSADTNVESAVGFVSMVGGGIQLETGTLDDSSLTDDAIILESGSTTHLEPFNLILEQITTDTFKGDGTTTEFTLTNLNANNDTITVFVDNVERSATRKDGLSFFTLTGTTLTFRDAPADNVRIDLIGADDDAIVLDGTDGASANAGHNILTELSLDFEQEDTHTTDTDQIVLEFDTFENLGDTAENGSIQKVHISDGGGAYTDIPTLSITTTTGADAKIVAVTDDIGAINEVKIQDSGFAYSESNAPEMTPRAHFVVKDVTGTFTNGNTLTTHTGTVKGFDSSTGVLDTTFENVVRVEQESSSTFQQGIQLEEFTVKSEDIAEGFLLEDIQDFEPDEGDSIVLEGTEVVTPPAEYVILRVKVVRNADDTANIYQINGVNQPTLKFIQGSTYYFDLSDSSLYSATSGSNHILRLSTTPNGTHGSGVEYTTGVTKSASYIEAGTTGAFLQLVLATDAPDLYYYCANHSAMGGTIRSKEVQTFLRDEGDNIVLDGSATTIFGLQLEDSLGNGFIREENTTTRTAHIALEDDGDNASIELEDGEGNLLPEVEGDVTDISESEVFGGTILLEVSTLTGIPRQFTSVERDSRITLEISTSLESNDESKEDLNLDGNFSLLLEDNSFVLKEGLDIVDVPTTVDLGSGQTSSTVGGFFVQDDGGNLLIDRFQEDSTVAKLLLDGTDSSSTNAGQQLATENAGDSLILNSTDGSDNANDKILFEDETGSGDILLDGTDSSSTDAGSNIINEEAIDFSNKNVTITDSSGASATIMKANIATITSSVALTQTNEGSYVNIQSLLGEDLNRIQDSYYYQDYSYEVQVGVSLGSYLKELQKAVHPAGFRPFGKVSIASQVSVALKTTAIDIPDYTGDDTFTPELASTLINIFQVEIERRMEAPTYNVGDTDDQILLENGLVPGDKIILDGKSTTSTTTANVDFSILLEDSLQPSGYGYDTAYVILDSSASGFVDEHSKIDLEGGVIFGELDSLLLETPPVALSDATFSTPVILGDTDGTNTTFGALVFTDFVELAGFNTQPVTNIVIGSDEFLEQPGSETVLLEDAFVTTGDNITVSADGVDNGRLMSESAPLVESGNFELAVLQPTEVKIATRPQQRVVNNLLIQLAERPFGSDPAGIQLENGEVGKFEFGVVVMDGTNPLPFNKPLLLEGDEDLDHVILETGSNILMETGHRTLNEDQGFTTTGELDRIELETGGILLAEDGQFPPSTFDSTFTLNDGDRIVLEDFDNVLPSLSDISELKFEDILRSSKILLSDPPNDQNNANATEEVGLLLEDFGRLLLDGSDGDGTDENSFLAAEEDTRVNFILEESGSLITETASTNSFDDYIVLEDNTDGGGFLEYETTVFAGGRVVAESFEIKLDGGQIPFENLRLNNSTSTKVRIGNQPFVRGSVINVRDTGEIVLEDGTLDNVGEIAFLVLDTTADAGDNISLEGATGIIP